MIEQDLGVSSAAHPDADDPADRPGPTSVPLPGCPHCEAHRKTIAALHTGLRLLMVEQNAAASRIKALRRRLGP